MKRRKFVTQTTFGTLALSTFGTAAFAQSGFESQRPPLSKRKFVSPSVEETLKRVKAQIKDTELAWMFENCFPNTLDTTVTYYEKNNKPYTYVITGDIDAMWLRDSTAQVWPYLPLATSDEKLKKLLAGVVNKQTEFVLLDPYANAFFDDPTRKGWDDFTDMKPGVHERKWEIDSLCYVIRLAYGFWKATGETQYFDDTWKKAMRLIVQTFIEQQRLQNEGPYKFQRNASNPTDSQFGGGYGNPTKKIGLIHSMFRPSDDATFYPFLISSNMFAVVSLRQLAEIWQVLEPNNPFIAQCTTLATTVDMAIQKYAIGNHPVAGTIYALEVDGFGNYLFMDDANIPNMLSLPYLGYVNSNDPLYKRTRSFSLSLSNPWYSEGAFAKGIGGPHVGKDKIWPLGLVMQVLTTNNETEIQYCLKTLKNTHANTGFIHESFDVNNPKNFSRAWFAWANTLFGEMILMLSKTKPHLLQQTY